MSEEIKKDRSPNYPKLPLEATIELVKRLYSGAGKAKVSQTAAVGALGYTGINGASLTTLGTLTSYGLIERERAGTVSVSPLAIKLLHPTNESQKRFALKESALMPKVFMQLFSEGFRNASEDVIRNHLIQSNFTPDGAAKAAAVYVANFSFANLSDDGRLPESVEEKQPELTDLAENHSEKASVEPKPSVSVIDKQNKKNVLANYSVPLGANEATITFTGETLSPEDFDALAEYVTIFKKQFERKLKSDAMKGATSMKDAAINLANATGQQ